MGGSGLAELWNESGILGPNTIEQVLNGKAYKKGMRVHKLTWQALWRLLMPGFLSFCQEFDGKLHEDITQASNNSEDPDTLITLLKGVRFQKFLDAFQKHRAVQNVNFSFWWDYMDMISILLMFTRAQREGLWDLHLQCFTCMLPYFLRYDCYNYGRWGPIYVAEMHQLPTDVLQEFKQGNFVVKCR